MQPRLSSSRRWAALPKELVSQIQSIFTESFRAQIGKNSIQMEGRIYPQEILMRVSIVPHQGGLKQSGFEISLPYHKEKDNVLKLVHLGLDAFGSLFEQYFGSSDDQDFPRIWQEADFEGRKLYFQYSTTNTDLEAQADRLLGQGDHDDLAQGDWEADISADQIKATLGIDSEE
jgi:hypothetical protein